MTDSFLQRGLMVLECLDSPQSLTSLSKKLNLPKSTVFRILEHLRGEGWVVQQHNATYSPGWRWRSLRGEIASSSAIEQELLSELAQLRDTTGWSINYLSFSGDTLCRRNHLSGESSTRGSSRIGEVMPLSTSTAGLAALGSMPELRSKRLLEAEYHHSTSHQHAHFSLPLPALNQLLKNVRSRGFAYSRRGVGEEDLDDLQLHCMAMPLGATDEIPPVGVVCASRAKNNVSPKELQSVVTRLSAIQHRMVDIYA